MDPKGGKMERTAPSQATSRDGPDLVSEGAVAKPRGSRAAPRVTRPRAGKCGPPARSRPAPWLAARDPRDLEAEGDPRDVWREKKEEKEEEKVEQKDEDEEDEDARDLRTAGCGSAGPELDSWVFVFLLRLLLVAHFLLEILKVRPRLPPGSASSTPDPALQPPPGPRESRGLRRTGSAPGRWRPREVLDRLRLRREEISAAAEVVNCLVDRLLQALETSEFRGVKLLPAGSYYEHVKISAPNEFDVMFKLEVPRIELEEYSNSGAYYFVKFKRNPKGNPLQQFVEQEYLSASKMLWKFREIIKEEIKNIKDLDVVMKRKKAGSPAVTLLIRKPTEISVDVTLALESNSSWPARTKEGLPIKKWLGAKVRTEMRRRPFYLVAKHANEGQSFQEKTWRLSFSHIEKEILNNHGSFKTCCETGGVRCCRKDCLKLMKYLLEELKRKFKKRKELSDFCSYHVKIAFFHLCTKYPLDSDWDPKDLRRCFDNCVAFFLERLREEELEHYFISGVNLFSQEHIDTRSKEFLSEKIEYERENEYPIFGKF